MIQRTGQGEGVVAVAFHLQREDRVGAGLGDQGIADPGVGHGHAVRGERRHRHRGGDHTELERSGSPHQQLGEVAGHHCGLGVTVGDPAGQLVLVHLAGHRRGVLDPHRQRRAGWVAILVDDAVEEVLAGIGHHVLRRHISPGTVGEVEAQLATARRGDVVQLAAGDTATAAETDRAGAVPGIGGGTDLDRQDAPGTVGAIGVVIPPTHRIVAAQQDIARDHPADNLAGQGIDQVIEGIHHDGRAGAVDIHILEPVGIDAVAHANGGDADAVIVDEGVPLAGHCRGQGGSARPGLLIGVAVADEEDLVAPARNRRVDRQGFLDRRGEVRRAVEWA
ncbi:hypothetical protein FQZ97_600240 [compost metagenome]